MVDKERLDVLMVQQGLFESRQKAQGAIMAGLVTVDGQLVDKPGTRFAREVDIQVQGQEHPYVSRGGLKLEQAIRELGFDPAGKVIIDIGASTGGFTDCALQHGAQRVYAVDVGHAQLAWKLRQDQRVVVMERTNARYLKAGDFPEQADALTIDVSFISLATILPPVVQLLRPGGEVVALIKPQFEAGRDQVGKRGVVREKTVHRQVIGQVWEVASNLQLGLQGLTFSPITGPEGNIEFLAWFKQGAVDLVTPESVEKIVELAHGQLV
ncbi:MAG TPA: TlyA family RNA methyltransferase [Firmicutes bacterium]|jgi:23S rRNA (cytidine1920-2'-O)/16S rRNA (cytidine1409-2'-O)-methyltransferase|nr:TlyA family RNA methyltransferase [Bacillota bacterium]